MGTNVSKKSITRDFSKEGDSEGIVSKNKIEVKSDSRIDIKNIQNSHSLVLLNQRIRVSQDDFINDPSRQQKLDDCVKNLSLKDDEDDQPPNMEESSRYPGLNGISHKSRHNLKSPEKEQIQIGCAQDSLISPNAEDRGEIQNQEQRLLGNQYYEDTNTLLGTDKLVTSIRTNILKDLNQSIMTEGNNKQFQNSSQQKTSENKHIRDQESYKDDEEDDDDDEEDDDDFKEATIVDTYFSDYVDYDWKQVRFRPQRSKEGQTIVNMINALSCTQLNYRSLQAQLNQQVKRNTKTKKSYKQSQFHSQYNKEQNKE